MYKVTIFSLFMTYLYPKIVYVPRELTSLVIEERARSMNLEDA